MFKNQPTESLAGLGFIGLGVIVYVTLFRRSSLNV
jgi:hypothetical protein